MTVVPVLWLDVETSGLDPHVDSMLEIAAVVTMGPLFTPVHEGFTSVVYPPSFAALSPAEAVDHLRRTCAPEVGTMHAVSGLWADLRDGLGVPLRDAEEALCGYIDLHCNGSRPILGGNSISFDRAFLEHHMPAVAARIHFRSLDCTSIWELAKRIPAMHSLLECPTGALRRHRALDDARASLQQARHFAEWITASTERS